MRQQQRSGKSDAILSCPGCFTTLCVDCQQHSDANLQHVFRAMFVMNCRQGSRHNSLRTDQWSAQDMPNKIRSLQMLLAGQTRHKQWTGPWQEGLLGNASGGGKKPCQRMRILKEYSTLYTARPVTCKWEPWMVMR